MCSKQVEIVKIVVFALYLFYLSDISFIFGVNMPCKQDPDTTYGNKLLKLFRKLMLDGKRHYQTELATEMQCSPQTIIRLMKDIEDVITCNLQRGFEQRKRWYQIKTLKINSLGLECEELRYLSLCKELASGTLPSEVLERIGQSILNLSMSLADIDTSWKKPHPGQCFTFYSKGKIDYSTHWEIVETLGEAIQTKQLCLLQYKAAGKSEHKEHLFAPARIVNMNNALYAIGALLSSKKEKKYHCINFAIHRIIKASLLPDKHKIELPELSPDTFGLPWHKPKTFCLHFKPGKAAEYVSERIWAENQKIEHLKDGGIKLTLTTCSEPELMAWVRSFGKEVAVI